MGRSTRQSPATAEHQLGYVVYVFASGGFYENVKTPAMNSVQEWGSGDHRRPLVEISDRSDTRYGCPTSGRGRAATPGVSIRLVQVLNAVAYSSPPG